jgi:hypothetical protein
MQLGGKMGNLTQIIRKLSVITAMLVATPTWAANHALIMWIGAYPADAQLPGIHLDAGMAKKLARAMGVPAANITEISNKNLTATGFASALDGLQQKIKTGDQVFIYYSGHGAQMNGASGAKCSEGMVGIDLVAFPDAKIELYLKNIANKARQVVMFNDSCFSGGQVSKAFDSSDDFEIKPKLLMPELLVEDKASSSNYQCGDSINSRVTKAIENSSQSYGTNFLYIAASSDKEVSFATSLGSAATLAWSSCLNPKSDTDNSGMLTGDELQACAQNFLNGKNKYGKRFNQNISLIGNSKLPLVFTADSASAEPNTPARNNDTANQNSGRTQTPNANSGNTNANTTSNRTNAVSNASTVTASRPVNTTATTASTTTNSSPIQATRAPATFADLKAMSNSTIRVKLEVVKNNLKIGQDFLEMKVGQYREAYMYIFYASASNSSIDLLFPNPRATNNKLKTGNYLFPNPDWALRSAGPAGDGAIVALTSLTPIDFSINKGTDSFETTSLGVKQFFELIGAKADSEIGVSAVVKVTEY